jgi:hypothetical protein
MHELEPYYNWRNIYQAELDEQSPFYGVEHSEFEFTDTIYGYCIHPQWDFIGSETLYCKVLYANYETGFLVIEFIGEWNDALHNDVMHLKRNLIDHYTGLEFNYFLLIGENVFNFHGSDDEYYEEWFDESYEGWIVGVGFQEHVQSEMSKFNIDGSITFGSTLDLLNWRVLKPINLFDQLNEQMIKRLN